jgi:glutathione S-transferase
MLYLYHGTTSVCSVKVRVALDDKSLAYDGEILDLRAAISTASMA